MNRQDSIKNIKKAITDAYNEPPVEIRVAKLLQSKGVTEKWLMELKNELQLPDTQFMAVANALRDLEKTQNDTE